MDNMQSQSGMIDQLDFQSAKYEYLSAASSISPSASPTTTAASLYDKEPFTPALGASTVQPYGKIPETLLTPSDMMYSRANYLMYHPSNIVQHQQQQQQQLFRDYDDGQRRSASKPIPMPNHCLFDQPNPNPLSCSPASVPFQWIPTRPAGSSITPVSPGFAPNPALVPRQPYAKFPGPSHVLKAQADPAVINQVRISKSVDDVLSSPRRSTSHIREVPAAAQAGMLPSDQLQVPLTTAKDAVEFPSLKHSFSLDDLPSVIKPVQYRCTEPGCKGRFKRQEHLKRHMKSHSQARPYVCWVPGCHRAFSRSDNLNAHYGKTHSRRGGRNRYVATLDETSVDYNPEFRGELTPDGRPIYESKVA